MLRYGCVCMWVCVCNDCMRVRVRLCIYVYVWSMQNHWNENESVAVCVDMCDALREKVSIYQTYESNKCEGRCSNLTNVTFNSQNLQVFSWIDLIFSKIVGFGQVVDTAVNNLNLSPGHSCVGIRGNVSQSLNYIL